MISTSYFLLLLFHSSILKYFNFSQYVNRGDFWGIIIHSLQVHFKFSQNSTIGGNNSLNLKDAKVSFLIF